MNEKKERVFGTMLLGLSVLFTWTGDYPLAILLFFAGFLWIVLTKTRLWVARRRSSGES